MTIHNLDIIDSTHHYCQLLDLNQVEEFTVYTAQQQTAGIGQRGNHWESEPQANITCSIILHPSFIAPSHQFQITETIAVAISDLLTTYLPHHQVFVKWPNDIYVGHHKICGTLLDARLTTRQITAAIVSIGLNINQIHFSDWIPNPTSLAILTQQHYSVPGIFDQMLLHIEQRYQQLRDGLFPQIHSIYLGRLLQLHQLCPYRHLGQPIQATILDVDTYGHLHLQRADGEHIICSLKELQYIFPTPLKP